MSWAAEELKMVNLGDKRRNRRLIKIVEDLSAMPLADRTLPLHTEKRLSFRAVATRNSRPSGESLSDVCDCRLAVTVADLRSAKSSD